MVFGKGSGTPGYQTMNDDDESQASPSGGADGESSPGVLPPSISTTEEGGEESAATSTTNTDVETGQADPDPSPPAQNWNTDSEDEEVLVEEEEVMVDENGDEVYEEEFVEEEVIEDETVDEEVMEDGSEGEFTTEEVLPMVDDDGFPDAAPMSSDDHDVEDPSTLSSSADPEASAEGSSRDPEGMIARNDSNANKIESSQKAPSPPETTEPAEQAPTDTATAAAASTSSSSKALRAPSMATKGKIVEEAKEDQCLSSLNGLVAIGILVFLVLAGITIGTGLGVAKPWETNDVPTMSPTATPYPTAFPTFAPIPVSPEDEELLGLWETVVGDVIYEEGTPYYEAAQWMLYRDPARITMRRYHRGRRQLQQSSYTNDDLDYIQRYLLVFLWYATTNNGRNIWLSCNPIRPDYEAEDCRYQKAIQKLPSGEIQYEPIPWTRWLSPADECDWAGVTCATTGSGRLAVSAIDLGGQGLDAPMEYIVELMKLPELKSLAFAYNGLTGSLETPLETLDMLDLTDNGLSGPLILLGGLSSLILEGNQFTGTLPTELFEFTTPLKHLNLGGNQLFGGIPPEASFALQLTSLQLHDNQLEGTIPPELGQLPLASLRLQGNNFNGPVPVDTVNVNWFSTLEEFWVFDNRLTGSIPMVLGVASRMLDLRLSGNNLVGGIPADLYNLDRLFRLELANNRLSGGLSISLVSQLTNLEVLDLSGNDFSGRILLDSRLENLQSLRLEFNQFTGNVPQSLCSISSLEALSADCLPTIDPPNPCPCCTACCDRSTGRCSDGDGSPVEPGPSQPPASAPSSSSVALVQEWARDTFGQDIDQSNGSPHSVSSIWITQADSVGVTPADETFLQRYVLSLFYFSTRTWLSCNPASSMSCLYQEYVENADGSFSYVPIPATRWLAAVSECEWVGVSCSSGTVTGIELLGQEINGELPTELATLPLLNTIKLAYNSLSGTIPAVYGSIPQLTRLEVQSNLLTGTMPLEICQISFLESLIADCDEVQCSCCTTCCINGECPVEV